MVKLPDRLELLARIRYHSAGYISRLQRDEAFQFLRASQKNLADANIELQKLAALDSLTGIANRRRFDEVMRAEWQRGQRDKKPLSLLMCDIDCFKIYNDSFGHLAGDLCLKKAAAVLTEHLKRPADLAARYGGEEFAIVLPDTGLDGALLIANACRAHIEQLAIENPQAPDGIVTHVDRRGQRGAVERRLGRGADRAGRQGAVPGQERRPQPGGGCAPTRPGKSMNTLENVTVTAKANIYFDGKCVSHTSCCADGSRKSVGVIFPSSLTFNTGAPEIMEITGGTLPRALAGRGTGRNIGPASSSTSAPTPRSTSKRSRRSITSATSAKPGCRDGGAAQHTVV